MRPFALVLLVAACSVNPGAPGLDQVDPSQRAGADAGAVDHSADVGNQSVSPLGDAGPTQVPPEDPPDCRTNDDCSGGDVCRSGECRGLLHGCASSADCHEGAVCSTQSGVCVETCEGDSDCPEQTRCAHVGLCLAECRMDQSDEICPDGTVCKENRRISDFPYCGPADEVRCGPGGTCPAGMGCNPQSGLCDEESACVSDRDCPEQQLCNQATGRCHDSNGVCGTDRDCPEEMICHRVHRRCTAPGWCETHHECPGREQCHPILEQCMDRCQMDRHCPDDQRCRESWCVDE